MNLEHFSITKSGQDAFEEEYEWTIVVFETSPDVFIWWNPSNYRSEFPPYNDGLPPDYDEIEEVVNDGYPIPELAAQVGALGAWGLDL
jgi:hypothetical protein